jgi:hypothetical protein
VGREVIIGQQRVVGLLTFLATPFVLLALPTNVFVSFAIGAVLGVLLLFADRLRTVGIGLLSGTITTFVALVALATMLAGVD